MSRHAFLLAALAAGGGLAGGETVALRPDRRPRDWWPPVYDGPRTPPALPAEDQERLAAADAKRARRRAKRAAVATP